MEHMLDFNIKDVMLANFGLKIKKAKEYPFVKVDSSIESIKNRSA
jgi:hypothetical protein